MAQKPMKKMLKKQKRNSSQKIFRDSIKYLTKEEWQTLKENIDNFRDKVIITLLYSSGARVAELSSMKIEHVDFADGFIRIPKENTKTKQPRTVRIGKEILSDLKALLRLEKRKKGYLFRSRQGVKLTTRRIEQILHKYGKKAGIQKVYAYDKKNRPLYTVSPHTLRHTHIVHALLNKVPITAVQKQVGHKRLTTTQIYSDLAPEQVKEAYDEVGFE